MGMTWDGWALTGAEASAVRADPESIWERLNADRTSPSAVDLDKAWHGIHWLLTGDPWTTEGPLASVIFGGEELDGNFGYGPPRLLDPSGVAAIAAALADVDPTTLRARFDPAAMASAEVYPDIWDDADSFAGYLAPNFVAVKEFYRAAAERGQWVLQLLH
ncbi:YfbM family protein [Microlunatus parietis]|uniref:DUF1877 domain-containing protein n=1 Tax=Microlunatus parietis TaxID=682979 RepID=A0A7Y9I4Z1_9ACTN|nr:YfbM family protein [Microlunatus parietis]NYE70372.1 hypothetical protein [Microlunatus parietis]